MSKRSDNLRETILAILNRPPILNRPQYDVEATFELLKVLYFKLEEAEQEENPMMRCN